jgi:predicted protein tyrosine phosphatase
MRVLFVCSGNVSRSPTAEALFGHCEGFEVRSAGTSARSPNPIGEDLVAWADVIFAMEEEHRAALVERFPRAEGKIEVLGIEDIYRRGDPRLVMALKRKLAPYFNYKLR